MCKENNGNNLISEKYVGGINFRQMLGAKCILSGVNKHFEIQAN